MVSDTKRMLASSSIYISPNFGMSCRPFSPQRLCQIPRNKLERPYIQASIHLHLFFFFMNVRFVSLRLYMHLWCRSAVTFKILKQITAQIAVCMYACSIATISKFMSVKIITKSFLLFKSESLHIGPLYSEMNLLKSPQYMNRLCSIPLFWKLRIILWLL